MRDLLNLLPQIFRRVGDSDEAREQAVAAAWAAAVGRQVRKVTAPVKLERKTLIVATTDSTWRAQLRKISGQALFKLNSLLGSPMVTAIEFVVNEKLVRRSHESPSRIVLACPEKEALPLIEKASSISDANVRETFLRAAGKCLDRRARWQNKATIS